LQVVPPSALQQGCPAAPQVWQRFAELQSSPPPQVPTEPAVPGQQVCPAPPQATQVLCRQASPLPHGSALGPVQQACPAPPQVGGALWQTPLVHTSPLLQGAEELVQQGCPAPPQAATQSPAGPHVNPWSQSRIPLALQQASPAAPQGALQTPVESHSRPVAQTVSAPVLSAQQACPAPPQGGGWQVPLVQVSPLLQPELVVVQQACPAPPQAGGAL
jgi:hypothetical protein